MANLSQDDRTVFEKHPLDDSLGYFRDSSYDGAGGNRDQGPDSSTPYKAINLPLLFTPRSEPEI